MQYSDYELKKIREYPIFDELCDCFFELSQSETMKEKLESILYEGGYKDYSISSKICNKDNPEIELKRRISMAYLLVRNEDTFDKLVSRKVNLFHGTTSASLESILKYGMNSAEELEKQGIPITSGEKWSMIGGKRSFISFTDVLDIADNYSTTTEEEKKISVFNVIIGTTVEEISKAKRCIVSSSTPEVGILSNFPIDGIKVIGVPSDKVEYVKELVGDRKIEVLAMDGIEERFYYLDDMVMDIYQDSFNKLKENTKNPTMAEINRMLSETPNETSNNTNTRSKK